ncbi:MAG: amidohydrolase [Acidobacteria bacterium]|nr:MAG: amidohydrolase [Acidobacteriota bacterium]
MKGAAMSSGKTLKYAVMILAIVALAGLAIVVGTGGLRAGDRSAPAAGPGTVDVTITEGTNFAVALSPDGKTLVADLLGSLWTIPAQGGKATRISDELLEARQPSVSPAGTQVAFQGFYDADGWDIWTVGTDGSNPKRVTSGPYDDLEPQWSHDGTRIAFSSDRSRNYDIWILDTRTGNVRRVTKDPAQDYAPAWSPDDREIAFLSTRQKPGEASSPGAGQPQTSVWSIDVDTGAERQLSATRGRLGPPTWSGDGKQAIYTVIADGGARIEIGGQSVAAGEDVFPYRVQWISPGDLLYTADGKIKRRTVGSDRSQTVEFSATIPLRRANYTKRTHDVDSRAPRRALGIVRPVVSPDGKRVAFAALGDIWVMDIGSKPTRVTSDRFLDADPAWSPDGSRLVYSSDRAETGNLDLWIRDLRSGQDRRLTHLPNADYGATWSPDGKRIAFLSMLPHQQGAAVDVVDVDSGTVSERYRSAQRIPSNPTWSPDGRVLLVAAFDQYSQRFREGIWKLTLIPATDGAPQILEDVLTDRSAVSGIDEGPVWSPDGTRIALVNGGVLRIIAVDATGKPRGEARALTTEAAHAPSWTRDSKSILYLATDRLKMLSVADGRSTDVPLDLTYQPSIPAGGLIVHAGRLWNGRDDQAQTDMDVVVDGNRIKAVQPHDTRLHTGRVVDASNQTLIPGLIEMHGHFYREYGEALGRLYLAYGITTDRDTAGMQYRSLEIREATDAGVRLGPRFYFSAPALDGTRVAFAEMYAVDSTQQLDRELERSSRLGYDFFKMYVKLPETFQKRIVEYGHQVGMPSSSHFLYPAVTFGADGTEHVGGRASALGNVYNDQMQLLARSGMELCPTIAVGGGFNQLAADDATLMDDERLRVLSPDWAIEPTREAVDRVRQASPVARQQAWTRLTRLSHALLTLVRSGGVVIAGTDAPNMPAGVGLHGELELYVKGGFTPVEALRTATVTAADALGAGADLGTIAPGKLADMVVIDGNPLTRIEDARRVNTVIKNGQVLDMKLIMTGQSSNGTNTSP